MAEAVGFIRTGHIHPVLDLPQLHQILPQGLIPGGRLGILLLQLGVLLFPCLRFYGLIAQLFPEDAPGGEEQPQVAVVGLPEFLPLVLPGNFVHLLKDGLGALVMLRLPQQLLQLLHPGGSRFLGGAQRVKLRADRCQPFLQFLHGVQLVFHQIVVDAIEFFEVAGPRLFAPGAGIAPVQISNEEVGQIRLRRRFQLVLHLGKPRRQRLDLSLQIGYQTVGGSDPAVQLTLFRGKALGLHLADVGPLVDGGDQVQALPHIGAVVDAAVQPLFLEFRIDQIAPCLPPCHQRLRLVPISGVDSVEDVIAVFIPDAVTVLVQHIFPALLRAEAAVGVQGTHSGHHVEVGIGDAALLVRHMNGEVCDHAFGDELPLHKLPGQGDVFLQGKFILQRHVEAVGQLGLGMLFGLLHGVPEGGPVQKFLRRVGRQENFRTDDAALFCVVADLPVVIAVQPFSGPVGRSGNGRLPGAAPDLIDAEMVQGHQLSSWACRTSRCTSGRAKTRSIRQ